MKDIKILDTMEEVTGKIVTINGKFVVIDQPPEEDGKQFANAIFVFEEKDKNLREQEIHTAVRILNSSSGGNYQIEGRHFSFSHLWMREALKNHIHTKMVVIYDKESREKAFLPLQYRIGGNIHYENLRLPCDTGMGELRVGGSPHFSIYIHCQVVVIKLQLR